MSALGIEKSTGSSSFQVVHWCSNILDCSLKDMSELVSM